MPTLIFLCATNSARSQLAEGLARARAPHGWRVFSAGSSPGRLSPRAVEVMREVGIDISHQHAKHLNDVPLAQADLIVTLCADEVCPVVPGRVKKLHWPLPDPAAVRGTDQEELEAFRKTRMEIGRRVEGLWGEARQPVRR